MGGLFAPQVRAESRTEIPEEFKPFARASAQFLERRLGETGPAWTLPFVAPMSPYETTGLAGMAGDYGALLQSGLTPAALEEWRRTVTGGYLPGANPYLADIERALQQQYEQNLAALQHQIAAGGQGVGTPLARVSADALTGYMGQLGGLRLGAYERERARQREAAQAAAAYGPSMSLALMQAGALPRTLEQQEIDRAYNEMQRLWNESYRAAGLANPLFGIGSGVSREYGPSPFGSLLGGLMGMWTGNWLFGG